MKTVRRIIPAALVVALAAASVFADGREALRQRLDSLDVETQVRKRLGKPIDDLEASSAMLRDSIVGMRSSSPPEPAGAPDGPFLSSVASTLSSFLESAISFKPSGLFDWIIVGTGVVAVLSGLLLFIGIAAGRRKKGAAANKKGGPKKINLAPAGTPPVPPAAQMPGLATYNPKGLPDGAPPPPPVPPQLESLMDTLRKVTPQTQQQQQAAPPPPVKEPPPPPPLPQPLVAEAPNSSPSTKTRWKDIPKAGSPGFSDSVAADAKSGMSDVEISRRYQISVDQVRLMLRMRQD